MHKDVKMAQRDLPYDQTEFYTPYFKYQHAPPGPLGIKPTDYFVVAYTDGTNWTEVRRSEGRDGRSEGREERSDSSILP